MKSSPNSTLGSLPVEGEEDEDSDEWDAKDGNPPPAGSPEWTKIDMQWNTACVRKHVFFRWSTAYNSKNKFKGIVTAHKSRQKAGIAGGRMDYLVIKIFQGESSEDRYMMGKDIRELYVLPNKTALMQPGSEDEIKARAVRKWTSKHGWTNLGGQANIDDDSVSTAAQTPLLPSSNLKQKKQLKPPNLEVILKGSVIQKKQRRVVPEDPPVRSKDQSFFGEQPKVLITTKHGKRTMGGRIPFFSFYN